MEAFLASSFFRLQRMVKDLLLVLKKERKIIYNQVRKKWQIEKVEKIEVDMYKQMKNSERDLKDCGVGDLN